MKQYNKIINMLNKNENIDHLNTDQLVVDNLFCCVCNNIATKKHISILGGVVYNLCDYHYENTFPAMGYCNKFKQNRMGLMNDDHEWVDINNNTNESL